MRYFGITKDQWDNVRRSREVGTKMILFLEVLDGSEACVCLHSHSHQRSSAYFTFNKRFSANDFDFQPFISRSKCDRSRSRSTVGVSALLERSARVCCCCRIPNLRTRSRSKNSHFPHVFGRRDQRAQIDREISLGGILRDNPQKASVGRQI